MISWGSCLQYLPLFWPVFLTSANFVPHELLNLLLNSGYALNLKGLIKVSKVSWTSQLSYEILRSSFERKVEANFISQKKTLPKSPLHLGLTLPGWVETLGQQGIEPRTFRLVRYRLGELCYVLSYLLLPTRRVAITVLLSNICQILGQFRQLSL